MKPSDLESQFAKELASMEGDDTRGPPNMPATAHTQSTDWMNPHAGEVRKLSTLLEVSQALLAAREFKTGLIRVLEILGDHHGAVRSTVVLLDERTGDVAVEASAGAIDSDKPVRYRLGEGITGEVVQSGTPMVVPQVSHEPRFLNRAATRPELARQELTYICVPIPLDGQTVGALVHRSALQVGPRLRTDHQIPRRGGLDDRAGDEGASAHRGRPAAAGEREHQPPARAQRALRLLQHGRHQPGDAGGLRTGRTGRARPTRPCCCAANRAPARS